jgi:hypothetical protein
MTQSTETRYTNLKLLATAKLKLDEEPMALRHEGEAEGEWPDHQQAARAEGRGDHQKTSTTMEGTQMAMSRMWTRLPHPTRGQRN